jgi:hypothetical protein
MTSELTTFMGGGRREPTCFTKQTDHDRMNGIHMSERNFNPQFFDVARAIVLGPAQAIAVMDVFQCYDENRGSVCIHADACWAL